MSVMVVYQSRGGHTKEVAEIIGEGVGVEPVSIADPKAQLKKHVDVLFIGGAIYKFRLDPTMVDYIANLEADLVEMAVCFGTSATTRRPIYLLQEQLKARGIAVHPSGLYMRGKPKPYLHEIGVPWAKREYDRIMKQVEEGTVGQAPEAPIVQMMKAAEEKKKKLDTETQEKIALVESEVAATVDEVVDKVAQEASERRRKLDEKRATLLEQKATLERELERLEEETGE